jgi:hypothetical protein
MFLVWVWTGGLSMEPSKHNQFHTIFHIIMGKDKTEKKEKKEKKERKRGLEYDSDDPENSKAARKAAKKIEKVAKALGYSNDVNPFGDSELMKPFVWGKKNDQDQANANDGSKSRKTSAAEVRSAAMSEIEQVRARRKLREEEAKESSRLRLEEHRLRELAQFGDWSTQEEAFHLNQVQQRSTIRITESREKCIDILAKNVLLLKAIKTIKKEKGVDWETRQEATKLLAAAASSSSRNNGGGGSLLKIHDPVKIVSNATLEEIEEIISSARQYEVLESKAIAATTATTTTDNSTNIDVKLEDDDKNKTLCYDYWVALHTVANAEKMKRQRQGTTTSNNDTSDNDNVNANVNDSASVSVSSSLHHSVNEDVGLLLKNKTISELMKMQIDIDDGVRNGSRGHTDYWEAMSTEIGNCIARIKLINCNNDIVLLFKSLSPKTDLDMDMNTNTVDGDVSANIGAAVDGNVKSESTCTYKKSKGEGDGITEVGDKLQPMNEEAEVRLAMRSYTWQDKYRPRKPRYINTVKTGWDWNKYNQTHYDHDNPPPRTVQGYTFTVFYPDLLLKNITPTYHLERADSNEFALLRFHVEGGPYEDIAFKILNKEWDVNKKAGFKVTFDKGVLNLQFNFKRVFYRR